MLPFSCFCGPFIRYSHVCDVLPLPALFLAGRRSLLASLSPSELSPYAAQKETLPMWCGFLSKGDSSQVPDVKTENTGLTGYVAG